MIVRTKHTALFTCWCIALIAVLPLVTAVFGSRIDQAALSWPIYFGLADMLCLLRKPGNRHELVALLYNVLVFTGLVGYLISQ
ncbi:MAG TPA: hypothetical protein VNU70_09155 [Puia sp.]|jgi:hypothetical protein|nr:hypothetical protein [Puia sp.]